MGLSNILLTVAEFAVGAFIIWGFFNEEKFVRFERRLFARIRRKNVKRSCNCTYSVIVGGGNCNKIA